MHAPRSNMSVSCHLDPPVPAASRSPALYHQSIIRTERDVRPLRLYKCIEGERREPVRRRCGGALGWSLVSGAPAVRWWCARVVLSGPIQIGHRDQPAARPDAARVPGRGRFAARGRGWRLPLVPRFAPVAPAPAPERDGWFAYPPVLCCAVPCAPRPLAHNIAGGPGPGAVHARIPSRLGPHRPCGRDETSVSMGARSWGSCARSATKLVASRVTSASLSWSQAGGTQHRRRLHFFLAVRPFCHRADLFCHQHLARTIFFL